ncbi:hypothetical protein [Ethanoligenens sp.]|uniref:hypothetical protein n=1 Tax=Ethanoligenens sp. TaxID=2099655 RepID=UPI0039EB1935
MANQDIKIEAKKAGVYLWQIADALNMRDFGFSRKLRHELTNEEKTRIRVIITEISGKESTRV